MYLAYDDGDHPYLPVLTHSFPTRRSSYLPTPASSSLPLNDRTSSSAPSPSPTWTTRRLQNAVQPAGPRSSSIAAPRRSCILAWHQFCSETIGRPWERSEEHTSELQSLMRISYAVFCLKKKNNTTQSQKTENKTETTNNT